MKKILSFFLFLNFFFNSCFYYNSPLRKAKQALRRGDCLQAKENFQRVSLNSKNSLIFAEEAAEFCLIKFLNEAIWFYEYLLKRGSYRKTFFQKKLAEISFFRAKDFEKALLLYSELRQNSLDSIEKEKYTFYIASSYYEAKKLDQALSEISAQMNLGNQGKMYYFFLFLEARILLIKGEYSSALQRFHRIQQHAPSFFKEHRMYLYLSLIYESQKKFREARKALESFKTSSDFLAKRLKRLKIRQKNQPKERPRM